MTFVGRWTLHPVSFQPLFTGIRGCLTSLNRSSAFLRKAQRKQQSISENHTLLVLSISLQDTDNAWVYTSLGHRRHNMKEGRVD